MAQNLPAIAGAAVACEKRAGLPAGISVAQCALESAWVTKAPANNCFGIKAYPGAHGRQLLTTLEWFTPQQLSAFLARADGRTATPTGKERGARKEYTVRDWFATFATLADCFEKHAVLITKGKPYAKPWTAYLVHHDPERLVREIAPIYATAPGYADSVLQIMRQANVRSEIATVRASAASAPPEANTRTARKRPA